MKRPLHIKYRLTLWYLLIVVIILGFFSLFAYSIFSRQLWDTAQTISTVVIVEPDITPPASGLPPFPEDTQLLIAYTVSAEWLEELKEQPQSFLDVITPYGLVEIDQKQFLNDEMSGAQRVELFGLATGETADTFHVIVIVHSISDIDQTLATVRSVLFYAVLVTAVLASALGFFLVRRLLKPLKAITSAASDIGEGNLGKRLPVSNDDELGQLAHVINRAFERLHHSFARERRFTADVSHELRTPLAVIQGETSLALSKQRSAEEYRQSLESISLNLEYLTTIVSKLLILSRAEAGSAQLEKKPVELAAYLSGLSGTIETLCENRALLYYLNIINDATIMADQGQLRELLFNLVDNAIKHTSPGGAITVTLDKQRDDAVIEIRDTGSGIAPEHQSHIFERFYRISKEKDVLQGAGLGLSIVKSIVEQHKGRIAVESEPGKGSVFRVSLPTLQE